MNSLPFNLVTGSPNERLGELERFIEHWLGARKQDYGVPAEVLDSIALPAPLRRFYAFLGNWPGDPMSTQNRLRPVDTIAQQKGAAEGLVEFAVENQGVYRWATLPEGDDPPVYAAEHWDELPADTPMGDYSAPGWYLWELSPLTDFLIDYALTELALAKSPIVYVPWSSTLEHYAQSDEANIVVLQRSFSGNPSSILVDGDYLLHHRYRNRWDLCAARTTQCADALARLDNVPTTGTQPKPSSVAAPITTKAHKANQDDNGEAIIIVLGDWALKIHADGSGLLQWKQIQATFTANTLITSELCVQLRAGNISIEHPPINVPMLIDTLESMLKHAPNDTIKKNLYDLKVHREQAVRCIFKGAVRINDTQPSTHAVGSKIVEAIWNQALKAIGTLPTALKKAHEIAPPEFADAAEFKHSFSIEHPDVHAARERG